MDTASKSWFFSQVVCFKNQSKCKSKVMQVELHIKHKSGCCDETQALPVQPSRMAAKSRCTLSRESLYTQHFPQVNSHSQLPDLPTKQSCLCAQ